MASVEVQILHGLPGSGKTYYSEKVAQEEKDKKVDITHLDDALIRGPFLTGIQIFVFWMDYS